MTFDGTQKFTYDAWNRLVSVAHAYRDGSNNVQAGHVWVTMNYDGRGRRISKAISGTGGWDATYKYYYDGDSLIETRNGSDQTLKQHVWGTRYIDELVQISTNDDPADGSEQVCETNYWVCQDANYNVLGIVDSSGVLKERYEYKPYGERTVFFSPGANDVGLYSPTLNSRRVSVSSVDQPYGICEVGHQGLVHDEEVGLVYNRARQLHPGLGRFMQRDPLGYPESCNRYAYQLCSPLANQDPSGRNKIDNNSQHSGVWAYRSDVGWTWVPAGGSAGGGINGGDYDMICPPAERAVANGNGGYNCFKVIDCMDGVVSDAPGQAPLVTVTPRYNGWVSNDGNTFWRWCCCRSAICATIAQATDGGMQDTRNVATTLPPGYP